MKKFRIEFKTGATREVEWTSFFTIYKVLGYDEWDFWQGVFPWIDKVFVDGVEIPKLKWHYH